MSNFKLIDTEGHDVIQDLQIVKGRLEGQVKDLEEKVEMLEEVIEKKSKSFKSFIDEYDKLRSAVIQMQESDLRIHQSLWQKLFGKKTESNLKETQVNLNEGN